MKLNWPAMYGKSRGVRRAYGLADDDYSYDTTAIMYDVYDCVEGYVMEFGMCSCGMLPVEQSSDGKGVFTARNHDFGPLPL